VDKRSINKLVKSYETVTQSTDSQVAADHELPHPKSCWFS